MKKIVLIIIIAVFASVSALALSGCSQDAPVPGVAWARTEILTYDITEGDEVIGTLTVTSERLEAGEHKIEKLRDKPFRITGGISAGTRVTKQALDTEGKEIMYSESLLNGFTSLASYKKVDFNEKQYELKVYHEKNHFYYSENGSKYERVRAKSGFADNELLYNIIRCYDIGAGYASSYSVLSPKSNGLEKISVSVSAAANSFEINYTDRNGDAAKKSVNCIIAVFGKSESPSGKAITVWYTPSDFQLTGSISSLYNKSIYIPVKMIENNLTYTLTNAQAL